MGTIFGKQSVAEPAFEVILNRGQQGVPYEIRRYGTRFAAQVEYSPNAADKDDGTPFRLLARYIGVFGTPENERATAISMTAPAVKADGNDKKGTPISMTAPVVKTAASTNDQPQHRVMQFILPAEYTSVEQIPKPTNPAVTIQTIPSSMGAVHRYSGSFDDDRAATMAQALAIQLQQDGLSDSNMADTEWVQRHYQFWGYNPPFTLPPFRRNEVWLPLTEEQVEGLTKGFDTAATK